MAKKTALLTDEQIEQVKNNPETFTLLQRVAKLSKDADSIEDKKRELSLDTILNICVKTTNIPADSIRGKKDYKLWLAQSIFYAAAHWYTSFSISQIAEYCGCQWRTVFRGIKNLHYLLNGETRFAVMAVLLECEKISKQRISKNVELLGIKTLKQLGADITEILNPVVLFSPSELSSFALAKKEWFSYRLLKGKDVFAYRMDGRSLHRIALTTDKICQTVFDMQQYGYRFTEAWGDNFLAETKNCNSCPWGRSGKCPASVRESYFCTRRDYPKDMSSIASFTVINSNALKVFQNN